MSTVDIAQKIAKAHELKELGNKLFRDDVKGALRQYHFAMLNIRGLGESAMGLAGSGGGGGGGDGDEGSSSSLSSEEKKTLTGLTETLNLNLAACYLRTEQLPKCIATCTAAIAVNENSAKAYFRRGQARLKLGDTDSAEKDIRKASQLAPSDVAIRKELQKVLAEQKRLKQKQAKAFKGFFDKLDMYDDKEGAKKPKLDEEGEAANVRDDEKDVSGAATLGAGGATAVEGEGARHNSNNDTAADAAIASALPAGASESKHSDPGRPD